MKEQKKESSLTISAEEKDQLALAVLAREFAEVTRYSSAQLVKADNWLTEVLKSCGPAVVGCKANLYDIPGHPPLRLEVSAGYRVMLCYEGSLGPQRELLYNLGPLYSAAALNALPRLISAMVVRLQQTVEQLRGK